MMRSFYCNPSTIGGRWLLVLVLVLAVYVWNSQVQVQGKGGMGTLKTQKKEAGALSALRFAICGI
jgi:ABC-type transporter Mla subunit MlaD